MTHISTFSHCSSEGRKSFTDEAHNFSLEIPEGAIPGRERLAQFHLEGAVYQGERLAMQGAIQLAVDVGVALFGPFQFPPGLRPVSPVFWVCVRNNPDLQFSKPVTVTLPHFLDLENDDDDVQSLGLTFLKADHNKNSDRLYEFQPADGGKDFSTSKTHGTLTTIHFCYLCIAAKDTLKCLQHTRFCITAVLPEHSAKAGKSADGYFFITFLNLKTCLKNVKDVIEKMDLDGYRTKRESFRFSSNGEDPAMEMVLTQPRHGSIGASGKKMVYTRIAL